MGRHRIEDAMNKNKTVFIVWCMLLLWASSTVNAFAASWMDFVSSILGVGATVASGGLFGIVGSLVGAYVQYKNTQAEREFEQLKWAHEDKLLEMQMQQKVQESEQELAIEAQKGSWSGLSESYVSERAGSENTYPWVNAVRGLYRPFLTTLLICADMYIWHTLVSGLSGGKSSLVELLGFQDSIELVSYMVYAHVFACTTAITWWFGDRAFKPAKYK